MYLTNIRRHLIEFLNEFTCIKKINWFKGSAKIVKLFCIMSTLKFPHTPKISATTGRMTMKVLPDVKLNAEARKQN